MSKKESVLLNFKALIRIMDIAFAGYYAYLKIVFTAVCNCFGIVLTESFNFKYIEMPLFSI